MQKPSYTSVFIARVNPLSILLLGATGYIGSAFRAELIRREYPHVLISRSIVDYTCADKLRKLIREVRPCFVINCAGYTGKPNVDACESNKADTLLGNSVLPRMLADVFQELRIPWGHISSGCIYTGAKVFMDGNTRIERDLMQPHLRSLWQSEPSILRGFTEFDTPNFSFRRPPCSFYSGSKALGEEALADSENVYVWRMRIPFDDQFSPRNYLNKLLHYPRIYDNLNSLSHRGEFVQAALDLWRIKAPFGIYNLTNPGWVSTRQVIEQLQLAGHLRHEPYYFRNDDEFYQTAATTLRSNTILDSSKLLATGVKMRSVQEALEQSIAKLQTS